MGAMSEVLHAHRLRIVAEVEAGVFAAIPRVRAGQRERTTHLLHRALDGLALRVGDPGDAALSQALRDLQRQLNLTVGETMATLTRLVHAARTVAILNAENKRAAALASAALDRALAETIPAIEMTSRSSPSGPIKLDENDPTILRNIREVLGEHLGTLEDGTVLAVSIRGSHHTASQNLVEAMALAKAACGALRDVGSHVILDSPSIVAAVLPARVDDTDILDALGAAIGLARLPSLGESGFGVARGPLVLDGRKDGPTHGVGAPLRRALALALAAGPKQVLVDAPLREHADATYVLRPFGAVEGAAEVDLQQPQWLDRWEGSALVSDPALVGRAKARGELARLLSQDAEGVAVFGVRGRVGSGKGRLVQAALSECGVVPDRVFVGEPHPLAPEPYWIVINLVRQLLELRDEPLEAPALEARLAALEPHSASPEELRAVRPALATLLGVELPAVPGLDEAEGATVRLEIARALRALSEARAAAAPQQPLVFVIHDAHRLDVPTAHALGHLCQTYRGRAPLRLILCYSGPLRLPSGLDAVPVTEVTLAPLSRAELTQLVGSMLETDEPPSAVTRLVHDRADGSPFAASSLVRLLVEVGALERRGGTWHPTRSFEPASVPRRLQTILARRIEHLPARLGTLLKQASVFGEPLSLRTVELLWVSRGFPRDTLAQTLGLLVELGFLERASGDTVRFTHALVRHVAYRLNSAAEKPEAHRLALVAYQERYPDAVRQFPAILFRHLLAANDLGAARDVAVKAAQRALTLQDIKGALTLATLGIRAASGSDVESRRARFDLLLARERAHELRGARDAQLRDARDLVAVAEELEDPYRLGVALQRSARLALLDGQREKALELAERAAQLLEGGDQLAWSNALRTLALVRWQRRDQSGAAAALKAALEVYEQLGHARGMGVVLHNLGLFALDTGALGQAKAYLDRALCMKEATEDHLGRAVVLDAIGQAEELAGSRERAAAHFRDALALRSAAQDQVGAAGTQVNLAAVLVADRPAEAEQLARAAMAATRSKRRQMRTHVEAVLVLVRALLAQSKHRAAARPSARAVELATKLGAAVLIIRSRLVQAEVDLAHADSRRTRRAATQAARAAREALAAGAVRWRVEALSLVALANRTTQPDAARAAADEALALMAERVPVGLDVALVRARCGLNP